MDYTRGALDVPRAALIAALLRQLGNSQDGNSTFTARNFLDLVGDRRYYVLTEEAARAFAERYWTPEPWVADVCDCDSKTTCAGADSIRAVRGLGWQFGLAALWLNYTSKSMGLPHAPGNRMAGYHQAPLVFVRVGDDIQARIVQPPHVYDSGKTRPALWQTPAEEMRFWVVAGGLT